MKNKQLETMNHSDGGGNGLDEMSDDPSSPESDNFDDSDLLHNTIQDDVTAQLAAAGKYRYFLMFVHCLLINIFQAPSVLLRLRPLRLLRSVSALIRLKQILRYANANKQGY